MKYLIILTALFLSSCMPKRRPASSDADLKQLIEAFHERVKQPITSMAECTQVLPAHYNQLFNLDWNDVGLENYQDRELERIVGLSFEIRLAMKKQMNA